MSTRYISYLEFEDTIPSQPRIVIKEAQRRTWNLNLGFFTLTLRF